METYTLIDIIKAAHKINDDINNLDISSKIAATGVLVHLVRNLTGWTLHFGGECPVDEYTRVSTFFDRKIDGKWTSENQAAGFWEWGRTGGVLAYRIVDPPKPKVDRSLRGAVKVKETYRPGNAPLTILDGLAWQAGVTVINHETEQPHLWTWDEIENAGWEVYKP